MRTIRIILTLLLFVCFNTISYGQNERGKFILGTGSNLNLSSGTSKWKSDNGSGNNGSSFIFQLSPKAGYFITEGFVLGLDIGMGFGSYNDDADNKSTYSSVTYGPFARYYFGKQKTKPFLNTEYAIGNGTTKSTYNYVENKSRYSENNFSFGGGLAFFLNDKISLDLTVLYSRHLIKDKEDNPDNMKNISSGLGAGVSFYYLIL